MCVNLCFIEVGKRLSCSDILFMILNSSPVIENQLSLEVEKKKKKKKKKKQSKTKQNKKQLSEEK